MQLETVASDKFIKDLKVNDDFELKIKDIKRPDRSIKTVVKVIKFVKKLKRCASCGIRLDNKTSVKFMGKEYCEDCYKIKHEEKSKKSAHKSSPKSFNGAMKLST